MEQGINLIKNKHVARMLAIILILIALILESVEFFSELHAEGLLFENLFAYIFEIVTNGLLIYALITKKPPLIEIALIVLKVFEGTYYPLRSSQRLDALLASEASTFSVVTHVLFAIAAFSLLFGLIFFCVYKLRGEKVRHWDLMKVWVLIASIFMFAIVILYIIEMVKYQEMSWEELLEPVALTVLFLGMFMTYEYVEEEIIYNE